MTQDLPLDVDDVILAFLSAADAGCDPDPADWLARYPQFAGELAPFFAVECGVRPLDPATRNRAGDDTPVPDGAWEDGPEISSLGDRFEWVESLGRGGMGDVSRMRDRMLGRPVAIKILQRRHRGGPHLAERFLDEARISAALQHPGVPPIHDAGTTPDGRPFLVMRLVEGSTLAELLRRRPDPSHNLPWFLKVFEQVAQTIAYAHSRGVLHRDLKPHNVMSGAFGEIQVMDWGLARGSGDRRQESGVSETTARDFTGNAERTVAGTVIGTPAYMAPEQARGEIDKTDRRADVFGLGAILCEILTGKPPFAGEHPLEESKRGDLADALRRLDATGCDAELRELAQRCLDPDPARRPADGQAVATAVVNHFAGVQERLRQAELTTAKAAAVRTHRRALRGLGVLAVVLVAISLVSVLVVQARANTQLKQKNDDLAASNDRERQRFTLALDAIEMFQGDLSEDLILKEKAFAPLRSRLLRNAADFHRKLEAQLHDQEDPASLRALARSYGQLGWLHYRLGDRSEAIAAFEKALALHRRLVASPDADPERKANLAACLLSVGVLQSESGWPEAKATLREAQELVELAEREAGEPYGIRFIRADVLRAQGDAAMHAGRIDEATAKFEYTRTILEALRATRPDDKQVLHRLAEVHVQLGQAAPDTAGWHRHTQMALGYHTAQLAADRQDLQARRAVAHCHVALGMSNDAAEIPPEQSILDLETGRDLALKLVDEYPFVTEFRRVVALGQYYIGWRHELSGRLLEARAALKASLANWQQLCDASSDVPIYRVYLARSLTMLAMVDLKSGEPDAVMKNLELAQSELERVVQETHSDIFLAFLGYTYRRIGQVHLAAGHLPEAAAATQKARDALAQTRPKVTNLPRLRIELAACHATLSELAGRPGSGIPPDSGPTEAAKAMELLDSDLNNYCPHPDVLTRERGFDSLRGRAEFDQLLRIAGARAEKARQATAQ